MWLLYLNLQLQYFSVCVYVCVCCVHLLEPSSSPACSLSPRLAAAESRPVDACASAPCHPGVRCVSSGDSYRCGACPRGSTGDGRSCHPLRTCPPGTIGDGLSCYPLQTCNDQPCYDGNSIGRCLAHISETSISGRLRFLLICVSAGHRSLNPIILYTCSAVIYM